MKKTINVNLGFEIFLEILFDKINFKEIKRVETGGLHSPASLTMTFEGCKEDFHEKGYLLRKEGNRLFFHTIKNPEGEIFNSIEDFLENKKNKQELEFEYFEF